MATESTMVPEDTRKQVPALLRRHRSRRHDGSVGEGFENPCWLTDLKP